MRLQQLDRRCFPKALVSMGLFAVVILLAQSTVLADPFTIVNGYRLAGGKTQDHASYDTRVGFDELDDPSVYMSGAVSDDNGFAGAALEEVNITTRRVGTIVENGIHATAHGSSDAEALLDVTLQANYTMTVSVGVDFLGGRTGESLLYCIGSVYDVTVGQYIFLREYANMSYIEANEGGQFKLIGGHQYRVLCDVAAYSASNPVDNTGAGGGGSIFFEESQGTSSVPGDLDNDDDVDAADIDLQLSSSTRIDVNDDGQVDGDDLTYLIETILDTRLGDLNLDGAVNITDFNIFSANFGLTGVGYAGGDIDGDGDVDVGDFNILAANFGWSRD